MDILSARFVTSSKQLKYCPETSMPEFAFIGRSNVGKSSLINMLVNNKKLAKTSSDPGKTQLINHFLINEKWYIVDLPGYGYAKVSKKRRDNFQNLINQYITRRDNLYCLFVLIDSRHDPMKSDIEFINWLGINHIPFSLVFTKIDKLKDNQLIKNLNNYKLVILKDWEELPEIFITSSKTSQGRDQLLNYIEKIIIN